MFSFKGKVERDGKQNKFSQEISRKLDNCDKILVCNSESQKG